MHDASDPRHQSRVIITVEPPDRTHAPPLWPVIIGGLLLVAFGFGLGLLAAGGP